MRSLASCVTVARFTFRPVAEYGVEPRADFGPYWPRVTTRHLLSQTSGEGRYEPGTEFLYDSGQWINHISYVLDKVTSPPLP